MMLSRIRASSLMAWLTCALPLMPALGTACEMSERNACEQRIVALVAYRSEAIARAFGDLSAALPRPVRVEFVRSRDPKHRVPSGAIVYDPEKRVLFMSRIILGAKLPNPLGSAASYWPFYEQAEARTTFSIVETIDDALWSAYLQEAATARGLTWDTVDCRSVYVEKRLPCEMISSAITRAVKTRRSPIFNENRVDRIWPEDFAGFAKRNWRHEELEYRDVQRYGGMLLIRPLIGEFGVPRVLAYLAQTPFRIEDNNVRLSAQRYQDRARDALRTQGVDSFAGRPGDTVGSFTLKGSE